MKKIKLTLESIDDLRKRVENKINTGDDLYGEIELDMARVILKGEKWKAVTENGEIEFNENGKYNNYEELNKTLLNKIDRYCMVLEDLI